MNSNYLVLFSALALSACATSSDPSVEGFGEIAQTNFRAHVKAVREHVRADRQALRAAFAQLSGAQGLVIARTAPQSDAGLQSRTAPTMPSAYDDRRDTPPEPAVELLQMEIGVAEMLTPEGSLHPRAAQALTRMDTMAREHGGDLSVAVPRSQRRTADAIRSVAPGATILEAEHEDRYRLIVVPGDR